MAAVNVRGHLGAHSQPRGEGKVSALVAASKLASSSSPRFGFGSAMPKLSVSRRVVESKGGLRVEATNSSAAVATRPQTEQALGRPTVLVAEKLGEAGLELLKKVANVDCSYNLTQEDLCAKISLCDALIVRSGTKVTREVFEASNGRLKVDQLSHSSLYKSLRWHLT